MQLKSILYNLPEVAPPTQRRLSFKEKLKWTLIILVLFFALSLIPLFGLGENQLEQFEILSIILGAEFGSLISLGIGPIVTASIVLQLLNGSGLIKFDLHSKEGRMNFQAYQKVLAVGFILFEAIIYVVMRGLAPAEALIGTAFYGPLQLMLIFQLILGGLIILFMDEVVSKWGFGQGIGLFIVAGVSRSLFIRTISPLPSRFNPDMPVGAIPAFIKSLAIGDPTSALLMAAAVIATVAVFALAVFGQSMKVEIPLSFGRVRGHSIRWPLHFLYTSNIPVILVAALFANIQLWARLLQNWGYPILGTYAGNAPQSGLVALLSPPNIVQGIITGGLQFVDIGQAIMYLLLLMGGATLFSWFWVQTSGMDAKTQAKNIMSSGLQIPGFRRDERVLERLLKRYITPLSILGGLAIGFLAGLADISGALTSGTGLLLAVMIVYRLYEDIARQHMMDMNPMLRKFMGG